MSSFSNICPGCQKRYGPPNPLGWVDIRRCSSCAKGMQEILLDKYRSEHARNRPKGQRRDRPGDTELLESLARPPQQTRSARTKQ